MKEKLEKVKIINNNIIKIKLHQKRMKKRVKRKMKKNLNNSFTQRKKIL